MPTITEVNATTGETTIRDMTDEEIISILPKQVVITVANTTKAVGESEPISIQVKTHLLSDGVTQNNVSQVMQLQLKYGDAVEEIVTDENGAWSDTIECDYAGTFEISVININSNVVTMEVS